MCLVIFAILCRHHLQGCLRHDLLGLVKRRGQLSPTAGERHLPRLFFVGALRSYVRWQGRLGKTPIVREITVHICKYGAEFLSRYPRLRKAQTPGWQYFKHWGGDTSITRVEWVQTLGCWRCEYPSAGGVRKQWLRTDTPVHAQCES